MPFCKLIILIFIALLATACAAVKPLEFAEGAHTESFSSAVSFSMHTAEQSLAGSGFLVYRQPDQMHLVVLAPFGSTLLEIFVKGNNLAFVYPSQAVAFLGTFDELPTKGGLQGISLLRWILDFDHRTPAGKGDASLKDLNRLGFQETLNFKQGLLVSRESAHGEKVYFDKYTVVNGVPFAHEIDLRDANDSRVDIRFDEPEVNSVVEDSAIIPKLDGMTLYPLSILQKLM